MTLEDAVRRTYYDAKADRRRVEDALYALMDEDIDGSELQRRFLTIRDDLLKATAKMDAIAQIQILSEVEI